MMQKIGEVAVKLPTWDFKVPEPLCEKCGDTGWYPVMQTITLPSGRVTKHEAIKRCQCQENVMASIVRGVFSPAGIAEEYWRASTFKDFHAGTENQRKAHKFLQGWMEPITSENMTYIWGTPGAGKTHLAIAWLLQCIVKSHTKQAVFISGADLGNAIRQSNESDEQGLYHRASGAQFLVIDDIQLLHSPSGDSFTMREFAKFVNVRYTSRSLTLITANFNLGGDELPNLAAHCGEFGYTIASRIQGDGKRIFKFKTDDARSKGKKQTDDGLSF